MDQKPKTLTYTIEDRILAKLLGDKNFSTDESAILELVKNAYDAGSKIVRIEFSKDLITIKDTGVGMDRSDITEYWMHVGNSHKSAKTVDFDGVQKNMSGSMGIGHFALARLGDKIELISQKEHSEAVIWRTDWNKTTIENAPSIDEHGTFIKISQLREKWTKKKIDNLRDFLSRTYNDTVMEIQVVYRGQVIPVVPFFTEPQIGINCLSSIKFEYDSKLHSLLTKIKSDEFTDEVSVIVNNINLNVQEYTTDILEECLSDTELIHLIRDEIDENLESKNNVDIQSEELPKIQKELEKYLKLVGDFSGDLFFYIKAIDIERFFYKYKSLADPMNGGIILYRNAFSISSFDGKKDWLELGKRSRKSPAAATHPTGAWRVRENQLSGKIEIDKIKNKYLEDLSNRQGINENIYYLIFKKIILISISLFEKYRQSIIRKINDHRKSVEKPSVQPISERIIKNPEEIKTLTSEESVELSLELQKHKENQKRQSKEHKEVEERYKYDVRILNVLATSGLKASSIAHEMKNDRLKIFTNIPNIIELLKQYELWEMLNSPDKQNPSQSIPFYLDSTDQINRKVFAFMNSMLSELEVGRFKKNKRESLNLFSEVDRVQKNWKRDYRFVEFNIQMDEKIEFAVHADVVQVILDNLILNSIQNNEQKDKLTIGLKIEVVAGNLMFHYFDDGVGLGRKYIKNPRAILEVHETSRESDGGHGLGMWMVNNSVIESGGEVTEIYNDLGFHIKFYLGDK